MPAVNKIEWPRRPPRLGRLFDNVRPFYFVTFNTYKRQNLLARPEIHETFCIFCSKAQEHGVAVGRYVIMPDHVHLLVEVDPQYGIHRLVRQIKGRSSRLLRHEYPWLKSRLPSLWTNSYFVSTVGGAPLEVIKQYIENQKRV